MAILPSSALAARVVVLGHHGHATVRNDPFVTGPAVTPQPTVLTTAGRRRVRHGQRRRRRQQVTVAGTLRGIYLHHHISAAKYHGYVAAFRKALATERRLSGTRRAELAAVTSTIHEIAAAHQLTAPRLPVLFATLAVNQQWWTTGPLLSTYQRVEIAGSQLVWEYYPGQGIQLQVLGTFGKADGLYTGGPSDYPALQQLLSEMIPMAARRAGGLAWEYYFHFDGGSPPWTSAMSQATGLEALSRAYTATNDGYYLNVAQRALPIFTRPPNAGVAEPTGRGVRFMQYTFAPHTDIINAFLQTLIGLDAYAQASGNPTAQRLFQQGNAEAIAEVPHYDTGAWSLYQPGVEDDLSYHELVTGFLSQLCSLVGAPVYCTAAQHFQSDLKTPPVLQQLTMRAPAGRPLTMRFRLSKVSHVGIVISQGSHTVFATSASFPYGVDRFYVPAIKRAGTYGIVLDGTDLAGNFARITGTLTVTPRKRHHP
ncbi:MAG TPA: D-glucuronyl C5-epimerase family protein [Solirubrobacteraceae bacterium]|nr:D-glucuronyl C5-epimerase family protein [Solirubrobacteraceae bacterium]